MSDFESIKERLVKLKNKLTPEVIKRDYTNENFAYTISIELLAGVIAGFFLGLFLDNLIHSKPLCIIVCTMLGIIASFRNIMKKLN